MTEPQAGFRALRRICPRAELWDEGGQPLVYLPGLKVNHAGAVVAVDALLVPRTHTNYPTRLFLSRPFSNRGQNWTSHHLMGGTWHVMSWNGVPSSLPWDEILANHLRPLQ
jgi:hypothetical protein